MPTPYINQTELGQYGVIGVPTVYLDRASTLIDSVLHRAEGLTWTPDANGWPCYQTRLTPRLTLTIASAISPGLNVVVPMTGSIDNSPDGLIGEVIILDRLQTGIVEACVVTTSTATSLTLAQVQFSHPGPVTFDFGLVVSEQKTLTSGRPTTHLGAWPIARIHSGSGRYGYGRHGADLYGDRSEEYAMLSIFKQFASTPLWQAFPVAAASWDAQTGHIWLPAGVWNAYYSEVCIRYVSGWSQSNIPELIKQSVAALATGMQNNMLPGNIISYKAGDTAITRAAGTILDADTLRNLSTFRAYAFA
jgi:hypothetical protein